MTTVGVTDALINFMVVTTSQCIHVSNYHTACLKYILFLVIKSHKSQEKSLSSHPAKWVSWGNPQELVCSLYLYSNYWFLLTFFFPKEFHSSRRWQGRTNQSLDGCVYTVLDQTVSQLSMPAEMVTLTPTPLMEEASCLSAKPVRGCWSYAQLRLVLWEQERRGLVLKIRNTEREKMKVCLKIESYLQGLQYRDP